MTVWHIVKIKRVSLREAWDYAQLLDTQKHQDRPDNIHDLAGQWSGPLREQTGHAKCRKLHMLETSEYLPTDRLTILARVGTRSVEAVTRLGA